MSDKQYEPTYEGQLDKCQDERHALQMQLEEYIEAFKFAHKEFHEALDDLAKMKAERDEARRMVCEKEETLGCDERGVPRNGSARDHAKQRGWDCFNTPEHKLVKTLNGVITDKGKATLPEYLQDLG